MAVRYAKSRREAESALRDLQNERVLGPKVPLPATAGPIDASAFTPTVTAYFQNLASRQGWSVKSAVEARVATHLTKCGIGPVGVTAQAKVGKYSLDFAVPDVRVAIEVDGPMHRIPERAASDLERDRWLSQQGWLVFRLDAYADDDLLAHVIARIARFINAERL